MHLVKKILPYLGKFKRDIGISCLYSTVESFFEQLIPLIIAAILDNGLLKGDFDYTLKFGGLMILIGLLNVGSGIASVKYSTRAGMAFGAELQSVQYEAIQSFTFRDLEKFGTPSLVTRLTGDVTTVQQAVSTGVKSLARAPSVIIFCFIMSYYVNPRISLMFLIMLPLFVLSISFVLFKIRPMYKTLQENIDRLNLVTQENLTGMRAVKAFVRREQQEKRFDEESRAVYKAGDKAFGFSVLTNPIMNVIMYAASIVVLWFGGNLVVNGSLSVGQLTSLSVYLTQILTQTMIIANVFLILSRSVVSLQRIIEVLEQEPDITDGPSDAVVETGDIRFENVGFRYGAQGENVLENINLTIASGETVGLIGGTGSAKTTLAQLIPRLYDVTEGTLYIGGVDVHNYRLETLRDAVSIVLQQNMLFSGSIRENLLWGSENAGQEELDAACRAACAGEFISQFPEGYDLPLGQGGVNVSGGQKQRLCIARAILKKPKILILDDSTSAVDMETDAGIQRALTNEFKDVTKLIIAQRISSVQDADKIIVLDEGRIIGAGTHEELLTSCDIYREIYEIQLEGGADFDRQA